MDEKIQTILDSFHNGQKKQMVKQIKDYGQARFFLDFYESMDYYVIDNFSALYTRIVYTFFLLK